MAGKVTLREILEEKLHVILSARTTKDTWIDTLTRDATKNARHCRLERIYIRPENMGKNNFKRN
jgi:hypothetical protein